MKKQFGTSRHFRVQVPISLSLLTGKIQMGGIQAWRQEFGVTYYNSHSVTKLLTCSVT